jgi:hypothetical protein
MLAESPVRTTALLLRYYHLFLSQWLSSWATTLSRQNCHIGGQSRNIDTLSQTRPTWFEMTEMTVDQTCGTHDGVERNGNIAWVLDALDGMDVLPSLRIQDHQSEFASLIVVLLLVFPNLACMTLSDSPTPFLPTNITEARQECRYVLAVRFFRRHSPGPFLPDLQACHR